MTLQIQGVDFDRGLREFVEKSFRHRMPALIEFSLRNRTVVKVLHHLKRHATGSPATAYQYVYGVWRYAKWLDSQPDKILFDCWDNNGDPLPKMLTKHVQLVDDFAGSLQDSGEAPGTIANNVKGVRALYRVNDLQLLLPRYPRTVRYPDRSPTPEELEKVLAVADAREKVIVTLPSLGGFREGTLYQLQYRHVKLDLEAGNTPCLVRVESQITKGHYCDYWTFLGPEAVEYLKAYLQERRQTGEIIEDESPLIRDGRIETTRDVKDRIVGEVYPVTPGAIWKTVHGLYVKAGLIPRKKRARRHDLRVHSLRYYFRTQLTALGVNPEYAEFMMGHKGALYNDIKMKGPEFLRNIYRAAGLCIRQKTKTSRLDMIKELVRGFGMDPEKVLIKDAISEAHRGIVAGDPTEDQAQALWQVLKAKVLSELKGEKP
jgi:hypothetical protein